MSFVSSPIFAISLGLLGVAGLYALHHLRTQPKRRPVATLMFWQQIARPQQTRSLWAKRFSHRRTFALLALIVLLIAAALLVDSLRTGTATERNVFVIDAGESMAATDSSGRSMLQQAIAVAAADLGRMGRSPAILTAGAQPIVQADAGQPLAGVRYQLASLKPQTGASAASLALQSAAGLQGELRGRIYWYTAEASLPVDLPQSVANRIIRRPIPSTSSLAITGVSEVSGNGRALLITVAGTIYSPARLQANFDGDRRSEVDVPPQEDRGQVRIDGIDLSTRRVTLNLKSADGIAVGTTVSLELPPRGLLSFQVVNAIPPALSAVLQSFAQSLAAGEIAVVTGNAPLPASARAAIRLVPSTHERTHSLITLASNSRSTIDLERAYVSALPTEALPGTPLLTAGNTVVASIDRASKVHTLYLANSLLDDSAELPRRAAFPVLMADWCNQLLARQIATVAVPLLRSAEDPLWQEPSVFTVEDRPMRMTTAASVDTAPIEPGARGPLKQILLSLALLLLIIEGLLLSRRKIV